MTAQILYKELRLVLHPAALLRNPKSKISAFEDFVALREKIEQVCDHTYNRS